jgi:sugar phosphate isomerase/epimerase
MEAAQFPQPLHTLLSMAGKAGCQIIQPTGRANHLDLRRAATDDNYRAWFRAKFMEHKVPMVSVSLHVVFYALLCIKHNPAAMQWVPEDCRRATPAETEAALWNAIVMMLIGAAVTGIEVIHLFFGKSEGLGDYPWDPYGTKDVAAMDAKTVGVLNALGKICIKLGIKLGHEIHPATMARSMRDFARVWKQLDKDVQQVIGLGFDPSHFWDGETWEEALWLAKELGIPVFVAHAKNALKREGFSAHGQEPLYTWRGQAFTHLDDPAGIVSMHQYLEKLQLLGAPFWFARGVPMGVHVEAEVQVRRQIEVTERGVGYLRHTIIGPMGWHPADGDFTDAMKS